MPTLNLTLTSRFTLPVFLGNSPHFLRSLSNCCHLPSNQDGSRCRRMAFARPENQPRPNCLSPGPIGRSFHSFSPYNHSFSRKASLQAGYHLLITQQLGELQERLSLSLRMSGLASERRSFGLELPRFCFSFGRSLLFPFPFALALRLFLSSSFFSSSSFGFLTACVFSIYPCWPPLSLS